MEAKGVVFEGKTLDDAVRKGLDALGLSRAEVMIQVMEEGSSGFLGIGARPYRVRMMPRPRSEMRERPERGGRGERGARSDRGGGRERGGRGERSGRGEREAGPRGERRERSPRGERDGRGAREPRAGREAGERGRERDRERRGPAAPVSAAPAPEESRAPEMGGERRRRRRRGRGRGEGEPRESEPIEAGAPQAMAEAGAAESGHESANGASVPTEELVASGRQLAEGLFQAMGFEARISAHADGDTVEVRAEIPRDSELITGEKGEVRQAIQHLLNRMLNRGGTSRYHLQLEINDFWAQREQELKQIASTLADEAAAEGAEKLTEYLNAQERRIIHVALRDDPRVKTYGLGDGLIKKVAIAPAGAEEQEKSEE